MFIALGVRRGGKGGVEGSRNEKQRMGVFRIDGRQIAQSVTQKNEQETWYGEFLIPLVPFVLIQNLSGDAAQPEEFCISCFKPLFTSCYLSLTKSATGKSNRKIKYKCSSINARLWCKYWTNCESSVARFSRFLRNMVTLLLFLAVFPHCKVKIHSSHLSAN